MNWWRDWSLTLVLLALFAVATVGQISTGRSEYNEERAAHGQPTVTAGEYLATGHPWEALFENGKRVPADGGVRPVDDEARAGAIARVMSPRRGGNPSTLTRVRTGTLRARHGQSGAVAWRSRCTSTP